MARSRLELNLNSPSLVDTANNTADVPTRVARWQPSPGVTFELGHPNAEPREPNMRPGQFFPVFKLYKTDGTELAGGSVITLAMRPKNSRGKVELVSFDYAAFKDLSSAEQRNRDYRGAVLQALRGVVGIAREGYLEMWLDAAIVVDLDHASTAVEIPVAELTGAQ